MLPMSVSGECYSRNALCELCQISVFLLFSAPIQVFAIYGYINKYYFNQHCNVRKLCMFWLVIFIFVTVWCLQRFGHCGNIFQICFTMEIFNVSIICFVLLQEVKYSFPCLCCDLDRHEMIIKYMQYIRRLHIKFSVAYFSSFQETM